MKIENLRSVCNGDFATVVATFVWEDCDRLPQDIYFQTTSEFSQAITCNPHSFVIAGIVPALQHGEKRLYVDAELCPELQEGLQIAMSWLRHWYGLERELVQIEAKSRMSYAADAKPERAGWFFSGGIDSLATLRHNHLNFSPEHPRFLKDGLTIYGISSSGRERETANEFLQVFNQLLKAMSEISHDAEVSLIPVYINVRQLDTDTYFWSDKFQGAALSAVAHAFANRLTNVAIASTGAIATLHPHGSHPLLDPNYSSHDLRIAHDGILLSRLEKTKLVADWDVALQNLKVCTKVDHMQPGWLNCGKCDKCIRTLLALLVLGKLEQARTFPPIELSEEMLVRRVQIKTPYRMACYNELVPGLEAIGRSDLVRAIQRIDARYRGSTWQERVKNLVRNRFMSGASRLEPLSASRG